MLALQRNRGTLTGWIVGVLAVAGIVACFIIYGVEARRTRENFDDSLAQRADDVANVVLKRDGSIDMSALNFARDLNTAGIDVYLFTPDGTQLFAPRPQRVPNLPALIPLKVAEDGATDTRTLASPGNSTRAFTEPIWIGEPDSAHIAIIVQTGRPEAALHDLLNKLRLIMALIGGGVVVVAVVGGLLLVRQVMVPVRRSLAQQQAFVANAAHELRTPLAVIQATTELALMRERSVREYRAALEEIGASVAETSTMIGDLLTLARIDAGRQPIITSQVNVGDLATATAEEAMMAFPDHPIITNSDGESAIEGDARLLQRLLVNLVENACHYTPPGTPIAITVRPEREWLAVRVRDEGPGIAPPEIEHLFERFYRGASGVQSGHHGAGLGLSLVQQIAEAHGGRVGIASFVGVGTTVTVLLPRSAHRFLSRLPGLAESTEPCPARAK
ncbi:MAG: HAMP domain-containing histidine kinase [Thermomicrobia bacterium]|nr:HAMP domain-containing histidine kinase [Thermomicrobia bacterium]